MVDKVYQLIIIGGGPAGLSAGIYAARSRLDTLLIEKAGLGGQILNAEWVENYPGFPQGISGAELGSLMSQQAEKYNLPTAFAEVEGIEVRGEEKILKTSEGQYRAKAVIIAGGSEYSKLDVPGEEEFRGRGVSYCAMCDGAFFKDEVVAVVGGGNVALNDALFITKFASKVIVIHRRDQLRATKVLQERALANPKMEFIWDTVLESIKGDSQVRELQLRNVKTGGKSNLSVSGVFIAVGLKPNIEYLRGLLSLSDGGFIPVNGNMETEVPGIFAAGDIRAGSIRQVIAAAGDGAIAAIAAEAYISSR
ncbi:MAG TPA: thioredoxin-disulfide reductase [Dehalococcoidia bacterium]|nr:thioredoxin-disulfide reductase [Dehalococcoidia bacterium]